MKRLLLGKITSWFAKRLGTVALAKLKLWGLAIVFLALAAACVNLLWAVYHKGKSDCEAGYVQDVIEYQTRIRQLEADVQAVTRRRSAEVAEQIRQLRDELAGATCATDTTLGTHLDRLCREGTESAC